MTELSELQGRVAEVERRVEELEKCRHIAVERIDIVEPDGSLRMVISGTARAPSPVLDGQPAGERVQGNSAGIIFYNEEGDECGGLVFKGEDGSAWAMLAFDQFKHDQVIALNYWERDDKRNAGLTLWDHPDASLKEFLDRQKQVEAMPEGPAKREAAKNVVWGSERLGLGRGQDASVGLTLHDPQGRARLRIKVGADGTPSIALLDAEGAVSASLP